MFQREMFSFFVSLCLDSRMVSECETFTLPQQFEIKYKELNISSNDEDFLRTCMSLCMIYVQSDCVLI